MQNCTTTIEELKENLAGYEKKLELFTVTQIDQHERIKKIFDDLHLQKTLEESRAVEVKGISRDVAEIDHRYKKQMLLLKTDVPMQVTSVAHSLINSAFRI